MCPRWKRGRRKQQEMTFYLEAMASDATAPSARSFATNGRK